MNTDTTQRNRPSLRLPRWRPNDQPSASRLNSLAEAIEDMSRGIRPPRQTTERHVDLPRIQRIVVESAAWDNTTFPAAPDDDSPFDHQDFSEVFYTYGRCYVLIWKQTTTSENGIYSYEPSARPENRWSRVLKFNQEDMQDLEIFVRTGRRFAEWRFAYYSENVVVPVFDKTIRINFASYESETTSGLAAMVASHTPVAGELIYVRNSGLYITKTGAWHKIGEALTISSDRGAYGIIASQQLAIGTSSFACDGGTPTQDFEYHELAVSPSLLNEAP